MLTNEPRSNQEGQSLCQLRINQERGQEGQDPNSKSNRQVIEVIPKKKTTPPFSATSIRFSI